MSTEIAGLAARLLIDPNTGLAMRPMLDTTGQSILAALQAQIELDALFVTDGTNYFVRRESVNEGTGVVTVSFLNLDGSVPTTAPTVANLKPITAAGTSITSVLAYFDVIAAGTGYAVGDQIARVLFLNTSTYAVISAAWYNLTQGTAISAPTAANIAEQDKNTTVTVTSSQLPAGAATAALQSRFVRFTDVLNQSLAANATSNSVAHGLADVPGSYAKFNAILLSSQSGSWVIQGSVDNFATALTVATGTLSANVPLTVTVPVVLSNYRAYIVNGGTAATASVYSSYTAA